MAKVATQGSISSGALHIGGGTSKTGPAVKRKTPSELRGEQLKRKNVVEHVGESPSNWIDCQKTNIGMKCGFKKPDSLQNPKYVDTQMNAVYPATKSSSRLRLLSRKENAKSGEFDCSGENFLMAKVATQGSISSGALHFGGGTSKTGPAVKRKTPSELRGEQLKRKNVVEHVGESPSNWIDCQKTNTGMKCGFKKPDSLQNPKYVDTQMNAVYPATKSSSRLRLLSRKENAKENSVPQHNGSLKSCSFPSHSASKSIPETSSKRDSLASSPAIEDGFVQPCKISKRSDENKFLSVKELSSDGGNLSGPEPVDLDKALKGLVVHETPPFSELASGISGRTDDLPGKFCSEFQIHGGKSPLDFTLKTIMRVVSSSSVNWFHRSISCGAYGSPQDFSTAKFPSAGRQGSSSSSEFCSTSHGVKPVALYSWVYPQSSLPPSLISALTLSAAAGVQVDFCNQRQSAWEDAFRNLYYMLRKRICDIFYVCTAQFVVMFIGDGTKESNRQCHAYISQSTRSLRSLLREHDIHYSMPLCQSKVEDSTTEDLVELSEMEKHNLGQIRRSSSMSDVDNSSQSLLAFSGNKNVHGLYDFLLNYRFLLTSLTGMDVPVLYSPVLFQNASLSSPEVKCKEVKTADNVSFSTNECSMKDERNRGPSSGFCYSIEITDAYLPPWIISSVCEAMHSKGMGFEASFITESASIGLNAGLEIFCSKSNPQIMSAEVSLEGTSSSIVRNTTFSPQLNSGFLKGLKCTKGSYTAAVSPI